MKTNVTNENLQNIKPIKIDFFNTSQFQTCCEIINKDIAFKLLMKINKIELDKDKIIVSEIEFFIDTIFYMDDDQFINLEEISILNNGDDLVKGCINIKFDVKNIDKRENQKTKIIFTEKIILEPNMGLHFIYYLNGTSCHGGGLCAGVKNCPIHIAGTTIANNK